MVNKSWKDAFSRGRKRFRGGWMFTIGIAVAAWGIFILTFGFSMKGILLILSGGASTYMGFKILFLDKDTKSKKPTAAENKMGAWIFLFAGIFLAINAIINLFLDFTSVVAWFMLFVGIGLAGIMTLKGGILPK